MHGQRRDEYKARLRNDATAAKLATKASQWHFLSAELIKRRKQFKKDEAEDTFHIKRTLETLQLTDKVLAVNPDPIYLWNHRRELLLKLIETKNIGSDVSFIRQEQIVTQSALQRNPKAYGAWFHRKWSIRQLFEMIAKSEAKSSTETKPEDALTDSKTLEEDMNEFRKIVEAELILCSEFLTLDERNFHCWNYRRFVVSTLALHTFIDVDSARVDGAWKFLNIDNDDDANRMGDITIIGPQLALPISSLSSSSSSSLNNVETNPEQVHTILQKEWDFTSEKINQNFSNGSAFDYRSKLLPLLLYYDTKRSNSKSSAEVIKTRSDWVQEELELIRNAIFTEPDDQTSWWYFRFILSWANPMTTTKTTTGTGTGMETKDGDNNRNTTEMIEEYQQMLYEEWSSIQELVEAEDGQCKWGLLGLYMIATTFYKLEKDGDGIHGDAIIDYEGENWLENAQTYLRDLIELDPDRKYRYESMEQCLLE